MRLAENSSGHIDCVWSHLSLVESSSGQAGSNRALTSSPVGWMPSFRIVKHCQESTAACWVNDTENMHVLPICQNELPALVEMLDLLLSSRHR